MMRRRDVHRATGRLARAVGLVRAHRRKPLPLDPQESAKAANCRYVDDKMSGIKRQRAGKGWKLVAPDGKIVRDEATVKRAKSLVIPPAWTDVWICPSADGHIQATGRDARGRKQYRYHPRFREVREETKYERMMTFAKALPAIRTKVDEDMGLPGLRIDKKASAVKREVDRRC